MATLENVNHDSGGVPTDHWDFVSDTGGRLSVTGAAALNSTANGLQIDYDASNGFEVTQAFTPPAAELALSFYFDPNGAATPSVGDKLILGIGLSQEFSFSTTIASFAINKKTTGVTQVLTTIDDDDGNGGGRHHRGYYR